MRAKRRSVSRSDGRASALQIRPRFVGMHERLDKVLDVVWARHDQNSGPTPRVTLSKFPRSWKMLKAICVSWSGYFGVSSASIGPQAEISSEFGSLRNDLEGLLDGRHADRAGRGGKNGVSFDRELEHTKGFPGEGPWAVREDFRIGSANITGGKALIRAFKAGEF